ncbi:Cytochrome P450 [Mycena chlorophos]|uniref:Cytochrome P450 n=1 Tax=Mycena chlorophos TaxID=658473 RepID=A0A8H6SR43_MYCCL|nr:Cytochrome P450 [Mycena chlorophos]
MSLPPGVVYLARRIPWLAGPPLTTYLAKLAGQHTAGITIPRWATVLACVLSGPVVLLLSVQVRQWRLRRKAAAQGAVLAPSAPGTWGGLRVLFMNFDDMYPAEGVVALTQLLGHTFTSALFFQDQLYTSDPENIKTILATDFPSFEKGADFRGVMAPLLGTGVFAADGDLWRFHRQMTRPFFHRARISDFALFDEHATHALALCKARLEEGHAVDMQDLVGRFTMDTATAFLFGRDVKSLDEGLPYPHYVQQSTIGLSGDGEAHGFAAAFQEAQLVTALRMRLGANWPLAEFWVDKLQKPLTVVRAFLDPILEEAIERKKAKGGEVEEGESLLDHLVNYTEDRTILRDEILNISVAGRDTTASLLTYVVYMLAEHPEVLKKLREEIMSTVGPSRAPTMDDFREMRYLRAVLNETLRLYPPVPFNMRYSSKAALFRSDGARDKPIYVPAGMRIPYSTLVMQRRENLWGPDALEFDPERFLDERVGKYLTPNPFIFLPFNAGPRICLGQQFAYHESSFFLVRLLQTFPIGDITLDADAQPPHGRPPAVWQNTKTPLGEERAWWGLVSREKVRPKSHLTLYVKGGLWVRM